jgi:GNAT superfamily N-acetyltransferase
MVQENAYTIQPVIESEIQQLQFIARKTFYEAFSSQNTAENMHKYLEEDLSDGVLKNELRDPSARFYFLNHAGTRIGYLKLNLDKSSDSAKDSTMLEIERIYIYRDFYGTGAGQLLLEYALQVARQNRVNTVWLGVWEHNPRAIRFYEKNGFNPCGTKSFVLGNELQNDVLMSKSTL